MLWLKIKWEKCSEFFWGLNGMHTLLFDIYWLFAKFALVYPCFCSVREGVFSPPGQNCSYIYSCIFLYLCVRYINLGGQVQYSFKPFLIVLVLYVVQKAFTRIISFDLHNNARVGREDICLLTLQKRRWNSEKSYSSGSFHGLQESSEKISGSYVFSSALRYPSRCFPWREQCGTRAPSTPRLRSGVELDIPAWFTSCWPILWDSRCSLEISYLDYLCAH